MTAIDDPPHDPRYALDAGPHGSHLTAAKTGGWGWTDHTPGAIPHRDPDDPTLFDHLEQTA